MWWFDSDAAFQEVVNVTFHSTCLVISGNPDVVILCYCCCSLLFLMFGCYFLLLIVVVVLVISCCFWLLYLQIDCVYREYIIFLFARDIA